MKPHQLWIEAFGPYADPVSISFDSLSQEGLFLIHGSTGAGKTFLLDALCFALYGEVSGDRSVKGLRSHHARPGAVPRVVLEFSCSGGRYRVERSPAHTAAKSRGEGSTEKAAQAALFRLVGDQREPIARRSGEVNREVQHLVGLDADQFRQVILLPQGRFAEVLRARAEEREALLKTLFDTVPYERAGHWLEEKARSARVEVAELERQLAVLRDQAAHEWSALAAVQATASGESEPEHDGPPGDQAALEQLREHIAAELERSARQLNQAAAALQLAQEHKSASERLADRWQRRQDANARLEQRLAQGADVEAFRRRLQRAERAEALRPSLESEHGAREELERCRNESRTRLRETARARDAARGLPLSLQLLDLTSLPAREELQAASRDLAGRRVELEGLLKRARQAERLRSEAAAADRLGQAAATRQEQASRSLELTRQQRQQSDTALIEARSARDQLAGLEMAAAAAGQEAATAAALGPAQQRQQQAERGLEQAEQGLLTARMQLQELRHRQIAGMAGRLAAELEPGQPCPVCGSASHPQPALAGRDAISDASLSDAEDALNRAEAAARSATAELARAQEEERSLRQRAGGAAADPAAAGRAAQEASARLEAARQRAQQLTALEQAISERDRQLQQLETERQSAATEAQLQAQAARDASAQAQTLEREITSELGEGGDPAGVLAALTPLEGCLTSLADCVATVTGAASRHAQASARLQRDLEGSEFADGDALRQALVTDARRQLWAERIQAYDTELIELKGVLASAELADLPPQRPDTAAAAAAMTAADQARTEALNRDTRTRRARDEIERLTREHGAGQTRLEQRRQRAQLLSAVADRAQGKAAPYISLQRWVLSAYLSEICVHANQRLELMTSGRYQLCLSDEGGRGGRQAGLALRVLDAYTGEQREVSSLSGGETFQASLALALGVADTVQAHAGGVHLEALFIDEGFGTLDPDNLQLAMDELDRLREGGRLIGIISHVGALRERIRHGIEVVASEEGSTLRVGPLAGP